MLILKIMKSCQKETMDSTAHELSKLLDDTKKQLEHLRILGVEGIRPQATAPPPKPLPQPVREVSVANAPSTLFGDLAPAPAKLTPSNETFEDIHREIGDCTRCPLYEQRTHVVHTEGNRKARLMFV